MDLRKILTKVEPKSKLVKVVRGADDIQFKLTDSSIVWRVDLPFLTNVRSSAQESLC